MHDLLFRHSEYLFRALIENAPDVVGLISADGSVLYASPAVRQFGWEPQLVCGQPIWPLLHPGDVDRVRASLAELVKEPGGFVRLEIRLRDARGNWRDKSALLHNLLQHPAVRAVVLHQHDVTELKQSQAALREARDQLRQLLAQRTQALRESEARYRRLIDSVDVDYIFYSQRLDGTIEYVSPSVRKVLGYTPEQILAQSFRPWLSDNPINVSVADSLARAANGLAPEHRECEVRHADGSHRILEYLDVPVFDARGRVAAVEGIARDITVRKRAEQQLLQAQRDLDRRVRERTEDLNRLNLQLWEEIQRREQAEEEIRRSERRFRDVVEDQTEFIVRWRPDGTRTFVNSAYCRFFGLPREQLIGQSFFPLIVGEESRRQVRELTAALTAENPIAAYEHRVRRPDGSLGWTQWHDRAIFDDEGKLVEFQSVGRDITAWKEAEERARQQQEELAHVARLSVMGEMVAAMGHEIGQPLHVISTFVSAASKALDSGSVGSRDQIQQWLTKVQEQVTRAGDIIRRLRAFTRADPSHRRPLDLNAAVRQALDLMAADLRRKRVRLELQLVPRLPAVLADPIQIGQVLVNLIRNAAEAMQACAENDRPLRITTARVENEVRVAVHDSGVGLSDEQLAQVGKAFFTTKPEGTGIGLAISRRIIEEHGGRLWPDRNEAGGATFTLALPVSTE